MFNDTKYIDMIKQELYQLGYPILNKNEFDANILQPSNIRYKTIEWLISECSDNDDQDIIKQYLDVLGDCDKIDIYAAIMKNFGIEFEKPISFSDYKKAIAGLSTNFHSAKILLSFIKFVKINNTLFKSKSNSNPTETIMKEIREIINYLADNKKDIFKENIRLFPPEIKLKKSNSGKTDLNPDEIANRIKEYNKVINKLNKKLDKLQNLNLNYEILEFDDMLQFKNKLIHFEKNLDNFIKDFNQLYSKGIKYISADKLPKLQLSVDEFKQKYDVILTLSNSLEEIFSLHNKILNYDIIN